MGEVENIYTEIISATLPLCHVNK